MTWLVLRRRRRLFSVDWLDVLRKVRDHQPRFWRMPDSCTTRQKKLRLPMSCVDWLTHPEFAWVIGHQGADTVLLEVSEEY